MGNKTLLPTAKQDRPSKAMEWDLLPRALDRWTAGLSAETSENTISIFDPIGVDPWTGEGVTAKRISSALRSIGDDADVVVNLNSPGGDMFEGFAIYNLLREHKGKVTVKILGLAASAASIIAMAGDEIQISRAGFLMIHNTWVVVIGNRNDLREAADMLEPFDAAMADIYAARTGIQVKAVQKKMDAETFINGSAAVEEGWADSLLPSDEVKQEKGAKNERAAAYLLDSALAKAGLPRSERRHLLQDFKASAPSAADTDGGAAANVQSPEKEITMNDATKTPAPAPNAVTQEQLKAEYDRGFADGKAPGLAEGMKIGTEAEAVRISGIMTHAEAAGRQTLAVHLAYKTTSTVEAAAATLAAAPKESAAQPQNLLDAAMRKVANPKVGADPNDEEETATTVAARILAAGKNVKLKAVK